ncbi:hypothetical protein Q8A67_007247 [Cirrhinus molitorella]|uniref:Uncharacterized protein n=1 Tax=Cirrhinus molitorella TaxID=172907 RepID=A0AA88PYT8_9TELE|nr:hypothetical protein Q8A67_007247 [Cirrhinus molitorella]
MKGDAMKAALNLRVSGVLAGEGNPVKEGSTHDHVASCSSDIDGEVEYGKEEWEAVGRILLKGYQDHGFFPVKLSLAFVACLIHEENKVTPEMLTESFLSFI